MKMRWEKAVLAAWLAVGMQQTLAAEYTNRLIVKLRAPAEGVHTIMSAGQESTLSHVAGMQLARVRAMSGGAQVVQLPQWMTVGEAQAVADRLQADTSVQYAEPDRIKRPMRVPNDTSYSSQWNLHGTYGIQAPSAWDATTGSTSVVVAVLDSGITDHSELSGRTVPGYDFISESLMAGDGDGRDNDPHDQGDGVSIPDKAALVAIDSRLCADVTPPTNSQWHGTAIAGLIGAVTDNNAGIAGINWVSKILPVRVLGKCGGYDSDITDGLRWAAGLHVPGVPDNPYPAKVLNLSLGGTSSCGTTWQSAIDAVLATYKVVVVSAGNEASDVATSSPANCTGVVVVAATTQTGSRTSISNSGNLVTVSAPGGESNDGITMPTDTGATAPISDTYGGYYGTSISAAEVSGVVSLMLSVNGQLAPDQVRSILQSTVTVFPANSTCTTSTCGAGIVNAAAAVALASTTIGTAGSTTSGGDGGGGGGGGGCAAASGAADILLPCLTVFAMGGLWWRRTRKS